MLSARLFLPLFLRLWAWSAAGEAPEPGRWEEHQAPVHAVAFTPDGSVAIAAGGDGLILLWGMPWGRLLATLKGHAGAVQALAVSADGRRLLSGGADKTTRLWDLASGKEVRRWELHREAVRALAFSPDGASALSGGEDWAVVYWDVAGGTAGPVGRPSP